MPRLTRHVAPGPGQHGPSVTPRSVLVPLDSSLRGTLQSKGTAATALLISVVIALYGTMAASPRTCSGSSVGARRDAEPARAAGLS